MSHHHPKTKRRLTALGIALALSALVFGCGDESDIEIADQTEAYGEPEAGSSAPAAMVEPIVTVPVETVAAADVVDAPEEIQPAEDPHEAFREGETLYFRGDREAAIDKLHASILARDDFAPAHYLLGLCYRKTDEPEAAEAALREALRLNPEHLRARINLARVLLDREMPSDALVELEEVARLDSLNDQLWNVRGLTLMTMADLEAAEESFERAVGLNPDNVYALNNLGLCRIRLGRFTEAVGPLQIAAQHSDPPAYVFNNLGIALERTDDLAAATDAFRKASDAGHATAGESLARVEQLLAQAPPSPAIEAEPADASATVAEDATADVATGHPAIEPAGDPTGDMAGAPLVADGSDAPAPSDEAPAVP